MSKLPDLDPAAGAHSRLVARHLQTKIRAAGGWLPFDRWMDEALYAPGLGYYAAGSAKLAEGGRHPSGDFVTAPELTPLFAQTLARQVAEVLAACGGMEVLEFGAGTGALAAGLLAALDELGVPARYRIVEVSADLRERQRTRLAVHGGRVEWLDALPASFVGCVVANEVLDAMPVRLFHWTDAGLLERGVALQGDEGFAWQDRAAPADLVQAVEARMPPLPGYVSEINPQGEAFVRGMGAWLQAGAALLIDYGFSRAEYYHPQRMEGTLMCHLRHVAHADPLVAVGVQDITAHVDFTAMAEAAVAGGLEVLGYASQAGFLMNAGLMELLSRVDPADVAAYAQAVAPVQKLLSPAEMGELFKVLAVGRGLDRPLSGFGRGDRSHTL
ncbi:class I SAM-dependent methyltransferase [Pigmentiphaga kullae]|uniref:SAM-dependent MidA family methyltransferase n=1 Tax=Pigmentiphaga kullae TaxID=151784 RepID=A0A4Q7NHL0_9BURK|nr:SAM-dependent methyltransferase [Pigmentiphaga kullae]RZS84465.1 SAM-dependent MidA family methyltransferase [Pigmentiphaga kullae]